MTITQTLCQEFQTAPWQIDAVIRLLDEGCTLPFIARYRKEQHGSLDDQKLREMSGRRSCKATSMLPRHWRNWRIFIARTARSAVPARRLPRRRGWSRSRTR